MNQPLMQVYIMCPADGGDLEHDTGIRREKTLVCTRCGARYPFTPDLAGNFRQREMTRA